MAESTSVIEIKWGGAACLGLAAARRSVRLRRSGKTTEVSERAGLRRSGFARETGSARRSNPSASAHT